MKNIHILPTDKPSRLYKFEDKLIKNDLIGLYDFEEKKYITQHIYITSDEEIKEGDWYFYKCGTNGLIAKATETYKTLNKKYCKKIIITTDEGLIKDGVQAIDDEFLEWFVKNSGCDEIQVKKGFTDGTAYGYNFLDYEIIIPKDKMKETAVEFLVEQLFELRNPTLNQIEIIQQAKEIEIQQLKDCWHASDENMRSQFSSSDYKRITFEQWLEKQ